MDDQHILALYFARDERAITETQRVYGALCRRIAQNLLGRREDAEECFNDVCHEAWRCIPPQQPRSLKAWLGRVTRNIAINRYQHDHAQRRYNGMEVLLSELDECIASPQDIPEELENERLGRILSAWLRTLPQSERVLFVRRYWYGISVQELSQESGRTPAQTAQTIYRLRQRLRSYLEKEDIFL